jgi:four helix bundle protein
VLNIYPVILDFVSDVAALVPRIAHHDPDLARQLRRSSASVVLNVAEGMSALGRSKTAAYNVALREMRESHAALDVSLRLGYVPSLEAPCEDRIQRILATLYRLSFPRRAC